MGKEESFKKAMVESYSQLTEKLSENGSQIVMFTHQNAAVWADLALILWASGLMVSAAWCIGTETSSGLKEGNYVQGTVLLVLRKQESKETAFLDELHPMVEVEVKNQLDSMLQIDDDDDPNFGDTDYQLAAYAAALRVLTRYEKIEDFDIQYELSKPRNRNSLSPIENLINEAVKVACDHLVPKGFDAFTWKTLTPEERFYLKGLDLERHGETRTGAYQELARGFGIREYVPLMASTKANLARLKTPTEIATRQLGDVGFGSSLLRQVLFAVRETVRQDDTAPARNWFHTEMKETYWRNRPAIMKILDFLAKMGLHTLPHWQADAKAAQLLSGSVNNDHL